VNRVGALRLSAILVVVILGISTVGFGLFLANAHAANPVASGPVVKTQSGTTTAKNCRMSLRTLTGPGSEIIVIGGQASDKTMVAR